MGEATGICLFYVSNFIHSFQSGVFVYVTVSITLGWLSLSSSLRCLRQPQHKPFCSLLRRFPRRQFQLNISVFSVYLDRILICGPTVWDHSLVFIIYRLETLKPDPRPTHTSVTFYAFTNEGSVYKYQFEVYQVPGLK